MERVNPVERAETAGKTYGGKKWLKKEKTLLDRAGKK
jgi:hypothetical protein